MEELEDMSTCSNCGEIVTSEESVCPNCGAEFEDLEEEEDEDEEDAWDEE